MTRSIAYKSIDEYIASYPKDVQVVLQQIRTLIQATAPDAKEAMSYGVPAFKIGGKNLVVFAAHKKHIGFYPEPDAIKAFEKELSGYETSEGTVKFPFDSPIPFDLIECITKYRISEMSEK